MTDATKPTVCPNAESCALFPRLAMRASLKVWTSFYCEASFEKCARFQLGREGKPLPDLLLPNGKVLRRLWELQ